MIIYLLAIKLVHKPMEYNKFFSDIGDLNSGRISPELHPQHTHTHTQSSLSLVWYGIFLALAIEQTIMCTVRNVNLDH